MFAHGLQYQRWLVRSRERRNVFLFVFHLTDQTALVSAVNMFLSRHILSVARYDLDVCLLMYLYAFVLNLIVGTSTFCL